MTAKDPNYQYTLGSHEEPSFKDIELLNKLYCTGSTQQSVLRCRSSCLRQVSAEESVCQWRVP